MKGFPEHPDGPMGPWYRKVNERIREAMACSSAEELVELLGPPDRKDPAGHSLTPSAVFERLGSMFRFQDMNAETVLTFVDPYRPKIRYRFSVAGGQITSQWKESVENSSEG